MDHTFPRTAIPAVLDRLPIAELTDHPYDVLAALRHKAPAVPVESAGARYWIISRCHDVRRVLADPSVVRDLVKYREAINENCVVHEDDRRARIPRGAHRSVFYQDGENHHRLRALAAGYFAPSNLRKLTKVAEDAADRALRVFLPGAPLIW